MLNYRFSIGVTNFELDKLIKYNQFLNMCCAFVIVDTENGWGERADNNKTEAIYISKARYLVSETPAIWTIPIPSAIAIAIQELSPGCSGPVVMFTWKRAFGVRRRPRQLSGCGCSAASGEIPQQPRDEVRRAPDGAHNARVAKAVH